MDKRSGHIYESVKGRAYKDIIKEVITRQAVTLPVALRKKCLLVHYEFYFRKLWNGRTPVERDADNPIKVVQDAVAGALKFNDCWVFAGTFVKRQGIERVVVRIEPFEDDGHPLKLAGSPEG
jgi:Holliday junction resolvase RusA-like endonuclease